MNFEIDKIGKETQFSEDNQPSSEAKSTGQQYKNVVIKALRAGIAARDIVNKTLDVAEDELENGNPKHAIELIKIAREPDKQDINLTAQGVNIQVASEEDKRMVEDV